MSPSDFPELYALGIGAGIGLLIGYVWLRDRIEAWNEGKHACKWLHCPHRPSSGRSH